jgi:hypothetical protein
MPRQFSKDDDIANAGVIVHVWAVSIAPDECTAAAQRLSTLMEDTVSGFPGFLRGEVLEADDEQSVLAISHWKSRHIWARAQWNQEVGKTLAALFQAETKMVDTMYYVRSVTRNTADPLP